MTKLESALVEVAAILQDLKIPYMLIGGLAAAVWGAGRSTLDADFSLWVEPDSLQEIVRHLCTRLHAIPADPFSFVAGTRVLPALSSNGVRADLVFASLQSERNVIGRAVNPFHALDGA